MALLARRTPDIAPGTPIEELDTPLLLLDLDRFDRNATRIATHLGEHDVAWRPHSKAHKSVILARRQVELGALGVTCAKVSEAEVMVDGGIERILIANELSQPAKYRRLAALQGRAEVIGCAAAPEHVAMAGAAGVEAGVDIPLLVEVDIGMQRVGVAPGEATLELARHITRTDGVRLAGIMGYEGHTLTAWPMDEKIRAVERAVGALVATAHAIEAAGIPVPIVSAGGSGSFLIAATVAGVTELQAGGACLMDRFYAEECHLAEEGFEFALTVLASVSGRPTPERTVIDAGFKTLSEQPDTKPLVMETPGVEVVYLSAEHGVLRMGPGAGDLRIGDRVRLLPEYSDTTTFRHDVFVGHRDGRVTAVIPLDGRGCLLQ